jgi:hypothetical protein
LHVPSPGRQDCLHIRPCFFKVTGTSVIGLPLLCNQCHIMKPYYQAWKASKHNFVPCVDCHYPPGLRNTFKVKYQALSQVAKWTTQASSSKPSAEIEDASCLRSQCHATRLLEGKVLFKRGSSSTTSHTWRSRVVAAAAGEFLAKARKDSEVVVTA